MFYDVSGVFSNFGRKVVVLPQYNIDYFNHSRISTEVHSAQASLKYIILYSSSLPFQQKFLHLASCYLPHRTGLLAVFRILARVCIMIVGFIGSLLIRQHVYDYTVTRKYYFIS